MNGVKVVLVVCLLALIPAISVRAQDKQEEKQQKVEKEVAPVRQSLPEIPEMPPMFGMDGRVVPPPVMALAGEAMGGKDVSREDRRKHAERIQLFRLWKIMEEVDLSDEQVDKFFPLMREYGRQERELADQRRKLMRALREELGQEKPSDAKLKEALDQLKLNGRQVMESKSKVIEHASGILTITQQARLALSLHDVERNIWESIARIRHMPVDSNLEFDKDRLHMNMQQLRDNLEKIKQEFEAKGLPAPDINFEEDGDVELKFRQPDKPDNKDKKKE